MVAAKKRKRVSKNKKKNWRKHTDIKDVEQFLEDKRLQEQTGGLVTEKPNDQLFFVEKKVQDVSSPRAFSTKTKFRNLKNQPLKSHSLLELDPKIIPSRILHNKVKEKTLDKRISTRVKDRHSQTAKEKHATKQKQQARNVHREKLFAKRQLPVASFDLWSIETKKPSPSTETDPSQTNKKPVKAPVHHFTKPSAVSAVEAPHPGQSYNPTYHDHQALVLKASLIEVGKEIADSRVKRALDEKFPTKAEAPTHASWLKEMSAGLFEDASNESSSDLEEDVNKLSNGPPIRRDNKKTLQQKKKERNRKLQERQRKKEKDVKRKKNDLFRFKSLKTEINTDEVMLETRRKQKEKVRQLKKDEPKKLGKLKFEMPDLEVNLSSEIQGSMRLLKPEGHLLDDRFKSLQKRNIIEPRKRINVHKRKYKPKIFEKKGHRAITI